MSVDAPIPFNRPYLAGGEIERVTAAIASRRWSGDGEETARASRLLEHATGGGRALLTTSCTHALEMAALLLDVSPGDEVIVPAFTFVSTANAFALRGARIVFVDVRPDTLNLDERRLPAAITPRTRAIVPVHYAGVACAMDTMNQLAAAAAASVVEDNAHGLFGRWRGRPLGSLGRLATQSFHETKNVSCGEGGALIVNDPALCQRAEIVREKGTNRTRFFRGEIDKYTWVDLGSSWLPSELLAAFLVAQLERAEAIQAQRHRVWSGYAAGLAAWADRHGVALPVIPDDCEHPAHLFYLLLDPARRPALLAHLAARGIKAIFHYQPLHRSDFGAQFGGDCPVTERVADAIVRLPLYPELTDRDVARIVDAVTAFGAVKTVAILQSSYLPWRGYFDIIHDADLFVFYDDVQFTRQDWRSRNKVKAQAGAQWLTVPVGGDLDRRICDVTLPAGWGKKHWKTMQQCYSRTPHFPWVRPLLEELYLGRGFATLSEMNQWATTRIAREYLGIATELADSRAFAAEGARNDRLLDLLGRVGATRYVSGPAARAYLDEPRFADAGIELVYKDYTGYPEYPQRHPPFDPFVTVIDLLCNVGPEAPRSIWGWR